MKAYIVSLLMLLVFALPANAQTNHSNDRFERFEEFKSTEVSASHNFEPIKSRGFGLS